MTTPEYESAASTSADPLEDVLVIPKFDTSMQPSKRKRQGDPFCRVLTSSAVIEQKRQKLAAVNTTKARGENGNSKAGKKGTQNNKKTAPPSQTAAGANRKLKNKKTQAAKKTPVVESRGKKKSRNTRASTRRASCKRTAKDKK